MSIFNVPVTGAPAGPPLDAAAVRHGLALLADPDNACQVQAVPSGRHFVLAGNDLDALVRACEIINGGMALYCLLNPVPKNRDMSGASGHATVKDILKRRWLLIDVDPVRPGQVQATAAERDAARGVAAEVQEYLAVKQWPAPLVIDSGGGFHLLYRVELPNDKLHQALLSRLLHALAETFDTTAAKIDPGTHAATQNTKIPGSWACKGQNSPERPWRQVRILSEPVDAAVVTAGQIAEAAGVNLQALADKHKAPPPPSPFEVRLPARDTTAYGAAALDRECARVALAPHGNRARQLYKSAAALGELIAGGVLLRPTVETALTVAAERCGLDDDRGMGRTGIANCIRRGIDKGMQQPRQAPERNGVHRKSEAPSRPPDNPPPEGARVIIRASEVTPRRVEWLWPGRIPLGKLTTFAGQGGLGKTFVLCDIAARVTVGGEWPCSGGECAEPGQVLFISGEDDLDDTLVPRMIEVEADLGRVAFLTAEVQDNFTLAALKVLTEAIGQIGKDTRLVVIDPPTSYLGGVNDHKNAELRGLLSPLKNWASENRVAIIFNTHVNKPQAAKVDAAARVMGSVAWVNAVRAAHMFATDPDDENRCLFVPMKANLSEKRKGLAYRLLKTSSLAKVEWLGEVETTANQAVAGGKGKPRRVVASEWLIERFREKLEWRSDELFEAAREERISRDAVFEAKEALNLPRARKNHDAAGQTSWVWWVPHDWPALKEPGQQK